MAQWAVLGVSIFDFCGVTSKVIYQKVYTYVHREIKVYSLFTV